LKRRDFRIGDKGLALGSTGYGVVVGGTAGSGVILLSLLMAAGVQGAGVIATDAAVSIAIGVVKTSVFGMAGVLTALYVRQRGGMHAFIGGLLSIPILALFILPGLWQTAILCSAFCILGGALAEIVMRRRTLG